MKKIMEHAYWELFRWNEHEKLEDILKDHRWSVRLYIKSKKRLKRPYHSRTGKPLKEVTLYGRKKEFERNEREYKATRLLIRLFLLEGIIGNPSDRFKNRLNEYFEKLQEETKESGYSVNDLKERLGTLKRAFPGYSEEDKNAFLSLNNFDEKIVKELNKDFKKLQDRVEKLTNGRCRQAPELSFEEDPIGNLSWMVFKARDGINYWYNEYESTRRGGHFQKKRSKRKKRARASSNTRWKAQPRAVFRTIA